MSHKIVRVAIVFFVMCVHWQLLNAQQLPVDSVSDTTGTALSSLDDSVSGSVNDSVSIVSESVTSVVESMDTALIESLVRESLAVGDSMVARYTVAEELNTKDRWLPDPKKAMWLAIAIPGGGQIYNRKYWKLPIFYGGFLGCFYALSWNNTMYRDYSQAYIDIMDSDDNTKSYMNFIPPTYNVEANMTRLQDLFKRKKNFYRRYRDMSLFCMIGVYLLSIIDAYVDAEMSSFDISRDLSIKVSPAIINNQYKTMCGGANAGASYGLNCSLNF